MKNILAIDNLLVKNLVASAEGAEYVVKVEQIEMLFLAFEEKIIRFSREELLNLSFYLKLYKTIEPGADNFITKNYLKLIQQYITKK